MKTFPTSGSSIISKCPRIHLGRRHVKTQANYRMNSFDVQDVSTGRSGCRLIRKHPNKNGCYRCERVAELYFIVRR